MMHSVTFGDKNTYDEWRIVPTSRPVINPPAKKKKTLEIPGASGTLDISSALTGYPVFENRTGSIEFVVLNDYNYDPEAEWEAYDTEWDRKAAHKHYKGSCFRWRYSGLEEELFVRATKLIEINDTIVVGDSVSTNNNVVEERVPVWASAYHWDQVYHDMLDHLHGEQMEVRLEDERGYYYQGGLTVNSWKSDKNNSTITVDYDLQPYRFADLSSTDRWLWDPFNFLKDYIAPSLFSNIQVNNSPVVKRYQAELFGNAPLIPKFEISTTSSITVTMTMNSRGSVTKTFTSGSHYIYEMPIYKDEVVFTFTGKGAVSIVFYRGYL